MYGWEVGRIENPDTKVVGLQIWRGGEAEFDKGDYTY